MSIQGKLTLIKICCTNKEKYEQGTILKFWDTIRALLLQENGIDFSSPRQTVERWLETETQVLMDEEMESGTTHDKDDFCERVEEFLEHATKIKAKRDEKKRSLKKKLDEAQSVASVQQTLLAGMDEDDEDYNAAQSSTLRYKKRRKIEDSSQVDVATIVVEGIKESMASLGKSLKEAMAGAGVNESRVARLEQDNNVLKERSSSILELLQEMRSRMP